MLEEYALRYPYLLLKFPGFTGADFSYFNTYCMIRDFVCVTFLVPLLNKKFKLHESLICSIGLTLSGFGYIFAAFSTEVWQYYCSHVSSPKDIGSKVANNTFIIDLGMHGIVFCFIFFSKINAF